MSDKIYIGNGKLKRFNDGGSVINATLCLDGLKDLFAQYGFTTQAGKHMLKVNIAERREPDQYGNTHYLTVDTWKPADSGSPF